jgi:hypothetical protein
MIRKTALLCGLLLAFRGAHSKSWSATCSIALMHDSNVFESFDGPAGDRLGRVWLDVAGRVRPAGPLFLYGNYSAGMDAYAAHPDENRMVNAFLGLAEIPVRKKTALGVELQGKAKTFLVVKNGYGTWRAAPYIKLTLSDEILLKAAWKASAFDFTPGKTFDYQSHGGSLSLESSPLPGVRLNFCFSSSVLKFKVRALRFDASEPEKPSWIPLGFLRTDRIWECSFSLEAYCWAFWLLGFSYQNDRSNGYGYSYRDPQIEAVVAKMLPWHLNVRLFWTHRRKTYTDPLTPFLQVRPDAEDETDSQALLDVSRKLGEKWTVRFRAVRYQNESPFRNLYYRKVIASLGCSCEL